MNGSLYDFGMRPCNADVWLQFGCVLTSSRGHVKREPKEILRERFGKESQAEAQFDLVINGKHRVLKVGLEGLKPLTKGL